VGRPVSMRVSYRPDASYLLRLEAALAKDERQSQAWRDRMVRSVRALAQDLLEADRLSNLGSRPKK
jgi:hypothetical protein